MKIRLVLRAVDGAGQPTHLATVTLKGVDPELIQYGYQGSGEVTNYSGHAHAGGSNGKSGIDVWVTFVPEDSVGVEIE